MKPVLEKLQAQGETVELEKILSKISDPVDLDFFILHKSGETPAGKGGNLLAHRNTEHLQSVFRNLINKMNTQDRYAFHKNIEAQKIYYALPLDNKDMLLVKVIEFETLRKEMTSLLVSILISSLVVFLIAFYLSYRLAKTRRHPSRSLRTWPTGSPRETFPAR